MQFLQLSKKRRLIWPYYMFVFFGLIYSCHIQQQVKQTQNKNIKLIVDSFPQPDAHATETIKPYKIKLDSLMNVQINTAAVDMKKELPEGGLGNMFCDVLMDYTNDNHYQPDFCLMNHGGIRIPTIYKGPIYVRTIFELMPFENQLILLKVKGSECRKIFELIAKSGGAPVSGLQIKIQGDSLAHVTIQKQDFDESKSYWILTSDYLANGGDKADALKNSIEMVDLNIKIRDALMIQIKTMKDKGVQLNFSKDGRITKY